MERVGDGVGTRKGTGKSMRKLCRKYPLANYPIVSPRKILVSSIVFCLAFLVLGNTPNLS